MFGGAPGKHSVGSAWARTKCPGAVHPLCIRSVSALKTRAACARGPQVVSSLLTYTSISNNVTVSSVDSNVVINVASPALGVASFSLCFVPTASTSLGCGAALVVVRRMLKVSLSAGASVRAILDGGTPVLDALATVLGAPTPYKPPSAKTHILTPPPAPVRATPAGRPRKELPYISNHSDCMMRDLDLTGTHGAPATRNDGGRRVHGPRTRMFCW